MTSATAGPPAKPVAPSFGLVGLHLAFDHGWTGRQVQVAHGKLARLDKRVPDLPLPAERAVLTIGHVLNAAAGDLQVALTRTTTLG